MDYFFYGAASFTIVEFTLHFLLKFSLNHLLNMITTMQIIVMFTLFRI